jgi:hypothetical protein
MIEVYAVGEGAYKTSPTALKTGTTAVRPTLATPLLVSAIGGILYVDFTWGAVPNATGYKTSLDAITWVDASSTTLKQRVTGTGASQTKKLYVIATGTVAYNTSATATLSGVTAAVLTESLTTTSSVSLAADAPNVVYEFTPGKTGAYFIRSSISSTSTLPVEFRVYNEADTKISTLKYTGVGNDIRYALTQFDVTAGVKYKVVAMHYNDLTWQPCATTTFVVYAVVDQPLLVTAFTPGAVKYSSATTTVPAKVYGRIPSSYGGTVNTTIKIAYKFEITNGTAVLASGTQTWNSSTTPTQYYPGGGSTAMTKANMWDCPKGYQLKLTYSATMLGYAPLAETIILSTLA